MKRNDTKALVEGALLAAISVILSLFTIYFPILGSFTSLFLPVPIIILGLRHSIGTSILSAVVASIVVGMISGPVQGITVLLGVGLIGVAMGWALGKDMSAAKIMLIGTGASLISKIALIFLTMTVMGINPLQEEIVAMRESLEYVTGLYSKMGMDPAALDKLTKSFGSMLDLLVITFPAILLLASAMDTFMCYYMTKLVLGRLGQKIKDLTPFYLWRLPDYTIPVALGGVLMGLLENYWPVKVLGTVSANIVAISLFCFWIQGFALLAFFLGKYKVSKIMRVFVVFLAFFNPFFSQLITIAGAGEIVFNFRRI